MSMGVPPDADRTGRVVVRGRGGLLEGVLEVLEPGQTLVVGRSRSCHVSLRRTKGFDGHPDPVRLLRSHDFNRVSRIHCEIECLSDGRVEIRDLSRNGTLVNGRRRPHTLVDPADGATRVELCDPTWGRLVVERG